MFRIVMIIPNIVIAFFSLSFSLDVSENTHNISNIDSEYTANFSRRFQCHFFISVQFCHGVGGNPRCSPQIGFAHFSVNEQFPEFIVRDDYIGAH